MRGLFVGLAGLWLAMAAPGPAAAGWLKAETDRFVVYSDGDEKELRRFVGDLSTFHAALYRLHPSSAGREPTSRLEVYLLRGPRQLQQLSPGLAEGVAGYYRSSPTGVYAAAIRSDRGLLQGEDILFHEYTHRFMLENYPAAYPAWLVEAYAEYFATMKMTAEHIQVGHYSDARAYSLVGFSWMPMTEVLSKKVFEVDKHDQHKFYAQSWLLLHYMMADDVRRRQLDDATQQVAGGRPPAEAFFAATGLDEASLTAALRRYMKGKLSILQMSRPKVAGEIRITALPPSADDFLLVAQSVADGVSPERAPRLLQDLRSRARRYPGDKLAELTLASAEVSIGDVAVGQAAFDRWIAAQPEDADILRQAAYARLAAAQRNPADRDAQFQAARPLLGRAYKLAGNDYRILYGYALARSTLRTFPSDNELAALLAAQSLAPTVEEIRLMAGAALLSRDRRDEARRMLTPLANSPHGGPGAERARVLLGALGPAGKAAAASPN